jgi:long-subunit fatty acid transport protein
MATRYCHRCGVDLGLLNNVYTTKFMKHTVPSSLSPIVSVFESMSTGRYENVISTVASGAVEIDDQNRRNFIWLAGERTGFGYEHGALQGPQDGVKVVLSSESEKIHAFSVNASTLVTEPCARCGHLIST